MLRPPLKNTLNIAIEQFQTGGGKVNPATNSGKVSIGQQSCRDRARKNSVKGRAA